MKKCRLLAFIILLTFLLTGCSFSFGLNGVDTLLSPPKLSEEHEQIYQALISAVGSKISLVYPKSGTYLSAFIIEDLDGDSESEAMVFYKNTDLTTEENTDRINILDKIGGEWRSVYDYAADGQEIEKVMVSKLGTYDKTQIIIGYSLSAQTDKVLFVYDYRDGVLTSVFNTPYTTSSICDADSDSLSELIILSKPTISGNPAMATLYKPDKDGVYYASGTPLCNNVTDISQVNYGKNQDGVQCIFIDELVGTTLMQTEVLKAESGNISMIFSENIDSPSTQRGTGYKTTDIDNDGILEIPVNSVFAGYENYAQNDQLLMSKWLTLSQSTSSADNSVKPMLTQKYSSYYNISDGFVFIFPKRWEGKVTAVIDAVNDEVVLCRYDGEITDKMTQLLRINVSDSTRVKELTESGYKLMLSHGETSYLAYLPDENDNNSELLPTINEVMFKLTLIEG